MSIDRITILKKIGDYFQQVMQWSSRPTPGYSESTTKYLHRAEALIELLEVADCGSVGGFDTGQPQTNCLFDRWAWLYRKYDDPAGERFGCDIASFEDIEKFFQK